MKKCPSCKMNKLTVVDSRSEVVDDVLRVIRVYQCLNRECSLRFTSLEKISNGEKSPIPDWVERSRNRENDAISDYSENS